MYSKWIFILLNVAYFLFNYIFITMIPNPIIWGIPLQLLLYIACAPLSALLWASYYIPFFNRQEER